MKSSEDKRGDNMVSIITFTFRFEQFQNIISNYLRQTYEPKELILVLHGLDQEDKLIKKRVEKLPNVYVYSFNQSDSLGAGLNFAIAQCNYEIVAKFDDDDYYAPQYLSNSIHTLQTSGADVVGKSAIFIYFKEKKHLTVFREGYANRKIKNMKHLLAGSTLVWRKELSTKIYFADVSAGEDTIFQQECLRAGFTLYSGDPYNYVYVRYGSAHDHSWTIDNVQLYRHCRLVAETEQFSQSILPYKEDGGE